MTIFLKILLQIKAHNFNYRTKFCIFHVIKETSVLTAESPLNMITLLAGVLVKSECVVDPVVYHIIKHETCLK